MSDIDLINYGAAALVLTGWLAIVAFTALSGWNGWLALKRRELEMGLRPGHDSAQAPLTAGTRIDIADLKERIRKLEAIASGVDL